MNQSSYSFLSRIESGFLFCSVLSGLSVRVFFPGVRSYLSVVYLPSGSVLILALVLVLVLYVLTCCYRCYCYYGWDLIHVP